MSSCSKAVERRRKRTRLRDNSTNTKLNFLNEIIHVQECRLAKSKGSWKVLPKDSIEIHKERQREQDTVRRRKEKNRDENNKNKTVKSKDYPRNSKNNESKNGRVTRRPRKYNRRKEDEESYTTTVSSVTSMSTSVSSCSCMDCY